MNSEGMRLICTVYGKAVYKHIHCTAPNLIVIHPK